MKNLRNKITGFKKINGVASAIGLSLIFATASIATPVTTLTWDAGGTSAANPKDGGGNWDESSSAYWSNGTTDSTWVNSNSTNAIIGNGNGVAGTISVINTLLVGDITFNPAGSGNYTLAGGALTISAGTSTFTTNADVTIGSAIYQTSTAGALLKRVLVH